MAKGDLELEIVIDGKKAKAQIKDFGKTAETAMKGGIKQSLTFSNGLQAMATTIVPAMIAAFAFDKIIDGFADSIESASDFEESLNKVTAVFGEAADEMIAFTSNSAKQFGLAEKDALKLAGSVGSVAKAMGFTSDEVVGLTKNIIQMGTDIGSFNNLPTEDVINRITKALTGEREGLKALGIVVNEERIKQEAAAKGITGALTQQQKATITLAIVQKDMADSQGDFLKTSDGLANKTKQLNAQIENISTSFGQLLLPSVIAVLKPIGSLVDFFESLSKSKLDKINLDIANFRIEMEGAGASAAELAKIDLEIRTQTAQDKLDDLNGDITNLTLKFEDFDGTPFFKNFEMAAKMKAEPAIKALNNAIETLNISKLKPLLSTMKPLNDQLRRQAKEVERLQKQLEGINALPPTTFGDIFDIKNLSTGEKRRDKLLEIKEAVRALNEIEKIRDQRVIQNGPLVKVELENLKEQKKGLEELRGLIKKRSRAEIILSNIKTGQDKIDAEIAKREAKANAEKQEALDGEMRRVLLLTRIEGKLAAQRREDDAEQKTINDKKHKASENAAQAQKQEADLIRMANSLVNLELQEVVISEEAKASAVKNRINDEKDLRKDLQRVMSEMNGIELFEFKQLQEKKKESGQDWSDFQQKMLEDANKALIKWAVDQVQIITNMATSVTNAFANLANEQRIIREQDALNTIETLEEKFEGIEEAEQARFDRQDEVEQARVENKNASDQEVLQADIARINEDSSLTESEKKSKIAATIAIANNRKRIREDNFKRAKNDRKKDLRDSQETRREQLRDEIDQIRRASEKQGALEKAVAISRTTIAMFEGATKAFSALAGIPFIGPILGTAAAAAAIAAGTSNISRILAAEDGAVISEPTITLLGEKQPEVVFPKTNASAFVQEEIASTGINNVEVLTALAGIQGSLDTLELRVEIDPEDLAIIVEAGQQTLEQSDLPS